MLCYVLMGNANYTEVVDWASEIYGDLGYLRLLSLLDKLKEQNFKYGVFDRVVRKIFDDRNGCENTRIVGRFSYELKDELVKKCGEAEKQLKPESNKLPQQV